jgi:hypothetical protein
MVDSTLAGQMPRASSVFHGCIFVRSNDVSFQVPSMGNFALIDPHTAQEHYSKKPYTASGSNWTLVFSDEFEVEGRSFYPGDDPYWEAVDLHYWQVIYTATLPTSRSLTSLVDEQHGMVRPFGHHD